MTASILRPTLKGLIYWEVLVKITIIKRPFP